MVTIEINERTKAGKALLAVAQIMAQKMRELIYIWKTQY